MDSTMTSYNDGKAQDPPSKRQKRLLCAASNRIKLDVGGVEFVAAASTLTANSSYFASLLSSNWSESNNGDQQSEIFVDQNPSSFGKILVYMREGFIKVTDIDASVLALAEFLGVERLLLAVKVRWYHNIGKGPVMVSTDYKSSDEEIVAAFDREHGGISKAMSSGLYPFFLHHCVNDAEKDFITMSLSHSGDNLIEGTKVEIYHLAGKDPRSALGCNITCDSLVGALNFCSQEGYRIHESQLDRKNAHALMVTFSRRKHPTSLRSSAIDILIPANDEMHFLRDFDCTKQFAMLFANHIGETIIAPAELVEDHEEGNKPFSVATVDATRTTYWLTENHFTTHEMELEHIFWGYIQLLCGDRYNLSRIYSRKVSLLRQEW